MFDLNSTIRWVTGVLQDPRATARSYWNETPGWQQSFVQLVLPVYAGAYLVALSVGAVTGGSISGWSGGVVFALLALPLALAWTFVVAFIFDLLSGTFGGQRRFDAAYAVVALAIVPAAIGTAISPVPWIGWLLSVAGSIYSLVLAYRLLPTFLQIPEDVRVRHFVLSVLAAIAVNLAVSLTIGWVVAPGLVSSAAGVSPQEDSGSVLFGGLGRQADVVEAAAADRFDPPADGRLTRGQMEAYVDVQRKTRLLKDRLDGSMARFEKDKPSLGDLISGVGDVVRLSTAEMEVVKSGGGNWAEHQWVRNQIETARIQQDLNATTRHNHALFVRYQDALAE